VRLPNNLIATVKKAGVKIYFADRRITKIWNQERDQEDLMVYGGWYWQRHKKGRVVQVDEDGPFRTESAAIRDAYIKLQLRVDP